jgi:hypothetical protein
LDCVTLARNNEQSYALVDVETRILIYSLFLKKGLL